MNTVDYLVISAQSKMEKAKEGIKNFFTSERGVSNVVATIIILLIVIIIIGADALSDKKSMKKYGKLF